MYFPLQKLCTELIVAHIFIPKKFMIVSDRGSNFKQMIVSDRGSWKTWTFLSLDVDMMLMSVTLVNNWSNFTLKNINIGIGKYTYLKYLLNKIEVACQFLSLTILTTASEIYIEKLYKFRLLYNKCCRFLSKKIVYNAMLYKNLCQPLSVLSVVCRFLSTSKIMSMTLL